MWAADHDAQSTDVGHMAFWVVDIILLDVVASRLGLVLLHHHFYERFLGCLVIKPRSTHGGTRWAVDVAVQNFPGLKRTSREALLQGECCNLRSPKPSRRKLPLRSLQGRSC